MGHEQRSSPRRRDRGGSDAYGLRVIEKARTQKPDGERPTGACELWLKLQGWHLAET